MNDKSVDDKKSNDKKPKIKGGYLRGSSWYYDFWYKGNRFVGCLGPISLTLAKERILKVKAQVISGTYHVKPGSTDPTFQEYSEEFMKYYRVKNKQTTANRAKYSLANPLMLFGHKRMSEISIRDIESYKATRFDKGLNTGTINVELLLLSHMFNKALEYGLVKENVVRKVKLFRYASRRVRFLTDKEEIDLLPLLYPKLRRIVIVAMNTGLRQGELLHLVWDDIDFSIGLIHVRSEHSKSGESRYIPMNKKIRDVLAEMKQVRCLRVRDVRSHIRARNDSELSTTDRVFPFRSTFTIRKNLWVACARAGIQDFHFHDLRHTFASRLVMKGVPLLTVKELLGHQDMKMTLRYAHLSSQHKVDAVELL